MKWMHDSIGIMHHSLEELDSPFTEKEGMVSMQQIAFIKGIFIQDNFMLINELEDCAALTGQLQPFVKEEVLFLFLMWINANLYPLHEWAHIELAEYMCNNI
ncbi:hypothetical protein ACJX0J_037043 [Zea mays]